jgi:hypothetical protein
MEDQQHVAFDEDIMDSVMETQCVTELTEFFELNKTLQDQPDKWLWYFDLAREYRWDKSKKIWITWKNDIKTIGRIESIHPAAWDAFHMRMLLNSEHCKCVTSFTDLMTLPGQSQPCESYKKVCEELGMLQDDAEWELVLEDAEHTRLPESICSLYVTILLWCNPSNPRALFDKFWERWFNDIEEKARKQGIYNLEEGQLKTLVLLDIKQKLLPFEKDLATFGLPQPTSE